MKKKALIRCPECARLIAAGRDKCPYCGCTIVYETETPQESTTDENEEICETESRQRKIMHGIIIGAIVLVGSLIAYFGMQGDGAKKSEDAAVAIDSLMPVKKVVAEELPTFASEEPETEETAEAEEDYEDVESEAQEDGWNVDTDITPHVFASQEHDWWMIQAEKLMSDAAFQSFIENNPNWERRSYQGVFCEEGSRFVVDYVRSPSHSRLIGRYHSMNGNDVVLDFNATIIGDKLYVQLGHGAQQSNAKLLWSDANDRYEGTWGKKDKPLVIW